jgi:hypothetical protein
MCHFQQSIELFFSILQLFDDPSAKKINIKGLTRQLFSTKTVLV